MNLLSKPHANPKLAKGMAHGFLSAPLHLAPAKISGHNVCPMSTKGCRTACLHTAGNPLAMERKHKARVARTRWFFQERAAFMEKLVREIEVFVRKADKLGMIAAIRLNATSDIRFEVVPCERGGIKYDNIMRAFPDTIFYDYTKLPNRRNIPPNYKLTFSLSENNDAQALTALANGMNVAAVVGIKKNEDMPTSFDILGRSFPMLDGDMDDLRFTDPKGVIVGLRPKGKAKNDKSGFVRSVTYA